MRVQAWLMAAAVVVISGCAGRPAPVYERSANPYRSTAPSSTRIQRPSQYVVRKGDTLYSIAWRYGLDFRTLAGWNQIKAPFTIYPDQRLRLSAPRSVAQTQPVSPPAARPAPTPSQSPATRPSPQTRPQSQPVKPPPSTRGQTPRTTIPPVAASSGPLAWQWPADGQVVTTFAANDPARKGIDIAGAEGSPVRASADGEVVYSGVGLIGYGELIIIKHDERFLSAYAHNRKRLVAEGERVTAGQTIAEMGRSGADRTQLHFEIRKNGTPVDPQGHLPSR